MVLDGAIDPDQWLNDPAPELSTSVAGFEDALDRFLGACAADQAACSGFGGADPLAAYDALLAGRGGDPDPRPRLPGGPDPGHGRRDPARHVPALYAKQAWGVLALALAEAEQGDASIFRELIILLSGGDPAFGDRFFAISGGEQQWPTDIDCLPGGAEEWTLYPHFWFLGAYDEHPLRAVAGARRGRLHGALHGRPVRSARPRRRQLARPGDAVLRGGGADRTARQRAVADDGRRRAHGVRGQLRLHRQRHGQLSGLRDAAGRGNGLPARGPVRIARARARACRSRPPSQPPPSGRWAS